MHSAKLIPFCAAIVLLSGCASAYHMDIGQAGHVTTIPRTAHACISIPNDGRYEDDKYQGSGKATAESVNRAFAPYIETTVLNEQGISQDQAISESKAEDCQYLFYSQILHWEDRATEWSGKPDRIALKLTTFSVSSGKSVDEMTFHARSSWWTLGGDHPQDLLYKPLKEYAKELVK